MTKRIVYALLLVLPSLAMGTQNIPTKTNFSKMEIETIYGDKRIQFLIQRVSDTEAEINLYSAGNLTKKRKISRNDWDFLVKEFNKLKNPKMVPANCYRSKIEIQVSGSEHKIERKSSCFGMNTATSDQYVRFARILAASI